MAKRVRCEVCRNEYYASVAGECPLKPGHFICMYCCSRKCKRSYRWNGMQTCRAKTQKTAEAAGEKGNDKKGGGQG